MTHMTRGFDRENPNHMRAARHLLCDLGLDSSRAIVAMTGVLDMTPESAFMYDATRAGRSSAGGIGRETQDLLVDWLGKRPLMDRHAQKESKKLEKANADLVQAKEICTQIQQVIPFLMSSRNDDDDDDPERLDLLQRKYLAVVAPSDADAFNLGEYLFFLDMFLYAHPPTRVLGKAVLQAWIYRGRAHEQDRTIKDAKFGRLTWFSRMHKGYVEGSADCLDKVLLSGKYVHESGSLPGKSKPFDWDEEGSLDLADLLEQAASRCATCQKADCKLKRCSACQKTYYCSRSCQMNHWKQHRELCKAWR